MSQNNSQYKEAQWFVLMVKPRHEKKVSDLLENLCVKTYNPTIEVFRKWSDRVKKVKLPAIPGIIFVKTKLIEKNNFFYSSSMIGWLYENKTPVTVNQKELELLDNSLKNRSWINNSKKIKIGDFVFLEYLGIDVIINKLGMRYVWASIRHSNISFKIKY
tara:strand:- start:17417 stop:17896 length:480 start_codon:yes stop_codon:yes gene_type:complete